MLKSSTPLSKIITWFVIMLSSFHLASGMGKNQITPMQNDEQLLFSFSLCDGKVKPEVIKKDCIQFKEISAFPIVVITDEALLHRHNGICKCFAFFELIDSPLVHAIKKLVKKMKFNEFSLSISYDPEKIVDLIFQQEAINVISQLKKKIRKIKITMQDHSSSEKEDFLEQGQACGLTITTLLSDDVLTNLNTLVLENCDSISTEKLINLLGSERANIEELRIKNLSHIDLEKVFRDGVYKLKRLSVELMPLSDNAVRRIVFAYNSVQLTELGLDMGTHKFPNLYKENETWQNLKNITCLQITNAQLTNDRVELLIKAFALGALESLDFSGCSISNVMGIQKAYPNLKKLDLSRNKNLTTQDVEDFVKQSTSTQSLKTLILKICPNFSWNKNGIILLEKEAREKDIEILA